jgi:hypothetical protein
VIAPASMSKDGSCNAAILAAVGVLKGRRLRGGRRRGCNFLLLIVGAALALISTSEPDPVVRPLLPRASRSTIGASNVAPGLGTHPVVEVLVTLLASNGRLGLRTEKNG